MRYWTTEEDEYLAKSWSRVPVETIARELGRSRVGVHRRVQRLRLRALPPGYEGFKAAAKRLHVHTDTLRRMFARVGALSRIEPLFTLGQRRLLMIEDWVADDVMRRWTKMVNSDRARQRRDQAGWW